MKHYVQIFTLFFLQAIKVELAYRMQVFQRFFGIAVSMSATTFFWFAVSKVSPFGGYSTAMMLCYFVVVSLQDFVFISGDEFSKKLGEKIRLGKLSAALVQPFPYLLNVFGAGLGGFAMRICIVIPLAVFAKLTFLKEFHFQDPYFQIGMYGLAFILAIAISLVSLIMTGLLAFDMTQVWAPWILFVASYLLLSGIFYPADQAGATMQAIMAWTPFYYIQGFPTLILIGRLNAPQILSGFLKGTLVLGYLILLLTLMWRRGVKKFEAVGI